MTPINLMDALAERIETIVKDYKSQQSDNPTISRAPRVWKQHLPEKLYDKNIDPADYPFVQVIMGGGTIPEEESTCNLAIMVAGYDDGQPINSGNAKTVRDRQGWMIPVEMMWRIIASFKTNPRIGEMYDLQLPITWELPTEQPAPMWYGLINVSFTIQVPDEAYLMDYWKTNPTLPNGTGWDENITT